MVSRYFLPIFLIISTASIFTGSNNVINISNLDFNRREAIEFLENGIKLLSENHILITTQKDTSLNNTALNQLIEKMVPAVEKAAEVLRTGDQSNPEYNAIIETIFNFITFIIGHTYWKILEINKDVFRYENGWYRKLDKKIEEQCAVEVKEQSDVSVSLFNKGEYSSLVAFNNDRDLQNLIKIIQYQELKHHEQLNSTRIAYIAWFSKVFGQTEKVNRIIDEIHKRVHTLFNYHNKTYMFDQIIRTGVI